MWGYAKHSKCYNKNIMHKTIDSAGVILEKSVAFYKEHWRSLIRMIIGYAILAIIVFLLFVGLTFLLAPLMELISNSAPAVRYTVGPIIQLFTYLVQTGIGVYFVFSLPKFLHDLDTHKKASVIAALESVIPRFWDLFFISLFFSALVSGGFIVLVVPGIYFVLGTIFYPFTAVLEHKKGIHALVASYWDTFGKKWSIFWRSLFISIVLSVVFGIFILIFAGLITLVLAVVKMVMLKLILATLFAIILALVVVLVFIPFSYIPQYMLYKAVKAHTTEPIDPAFQKNKEKKFKIFIGIGFAVIVLGLVGSSFLAGLAEKLDTRMPSGVVTTEAKEYTNTQLMYSITYPGQYTTPSDEDANPAIFLNLKEGGDNVVVVASDTETLTEKDILEQISSDPRISDEPLVLSRSKTTVAGVSADDVVITTNFKGIQAKSRAVYFKLADGWSFLFFHSCLVSKCDDAGFDGLLKGVKFN